VIFTLDFSLLRLMVVFGWARLIMRREYAGFRWYPLDYALISWATASGIAGVIRAGTFAIFVNKLGLAFDALGTYFLFRMLVRDFRDVKTVALGFAAISIPVGIAFLVENATARNMFSVFGGVPEITFLRQGRVRWAPLPRQRRPCG